MTDTSIDLVTLTDADTAYKRIKSKIISLDLPPGTPINQYELVDELGVGRTPVREALKRLEYENLIVSIHRRGMSVAQIALNDLRHIYEIRIELEAGCARLAAQRANNAQIDELDQTLKSLLATDIHDSKLVAERERQLHFAIADCSQSPLLIKELKHYYGMALRIWCFLLDRLPPGCLDIESHNVLVDAIRERNSAQADILMRSHVTAVFDTVKSYL